MLHVIASNITVLVFARVVVEAVSSGWSSFTAHVVVVVVVVEAACVAVVAVVVGIVAVVAKQVRSAFAEAVA